MPAKPRTSKRRTKSTRRKNPRRRNVEGMHGMGLEGKDPEMSYVWVSEDEWSVAQYRQIGYEVVEAGTDSPRPAGMKLPDGQEIRMYGHVLMAIPQEEKDEIEEFGPYGEGGQRRADQIEAAMLDRRGQADPMRGINLRRGVHVDVVPDTIHGGPQKHGEDVDELLSPS